MPPRPDAPLRRVTLNLYEADCQALEKWHGQGWTVRIREIIHSRVQEVQPSSQLRQRANGTPRTLGDLSDD